MMTESVLVFRTDVARVPRCGFQPFKKLIRHEVALCFAWTGG